MKLSNEKLKAQKQQFDIDLQKLQIEIMNKNLIIENYKQIEKFKDSGDRQIEQQPKVKFLPEVQIGEKEKATDLKLDEFKLENKQLKDRLKFFELNQKYIEDDVIEIDLKNKEIKKLNDKIKLLENGKNLPESIKKLKDAQSHIRELEQIVKRYRAKPTHETADPLLKRVDYYEKRIDLLENSLKEKIKDYERLERMWAQKYEILKSILDENTKEFSLNEKNFSQFHRLDEALNEKLKKVEENYQKSLLQLEIENGDLKKIVNKAESEANKKISELNAIKQTLEADLANQKNDFKLLLNKHENTVIMQQQNKKEYEPKIFKDSPTMSDFSNENAKLILDENARLKRKYDELEIEFNKRVEQFDLTLMQIKEANSIQINTLKEQYKFEIEKFLQALFGIQNNSFNMNDENLLKNIRIKFVEMKQEIDEKNILVKSLNEKCKDLELVKNKCVEKSSKLENVNSSLNERIEELNNELKLARLYYSPEMKHYESLNNKLKAIEIKYKKREKELNDLMYNKSNYGIDEDYNKEFDIENSIQVQNLIQYYKNILEKKDAEILKFRFELDSMLELLNSLQMIVR